MEASQVASAKAHLSAHYGPWTAHNIEVAPGVFTMNDRDHRHNEPVFQAAVQTAQDVLGRSVKKMRVLDLACLEGGFGIEFARHLADVTAVEIRRASIEKAKFAARSLGLRNIQFLQADVRTLAVEDMGRFDVILAWGILYHLDVPDVFTFLENLKDMCKGVLIIDTHVSLRPTAEVAFRGETYAGHFVKEHEADATREVKAQSLWASADNSQSFWPTRPSLFNFLSRLGFTSIFENASPRLALHGIDRINVTALAGPRADIFRQGTGPAAPPLTWRENDPRFALRL